jgi:two-component system OmpR family response regulator
MLPRPRILIAEDDHGIRDLIRTRLEIAGYEVHLARTGREAVTSVKGLKPRAMVLDINMPELDGFGVLTELKAENIGLPVLLLTARHTTDDVRRAIGLGAKDYLTKPFSEAQLLARVTPLLRPPIEAPPREIIG